MAEEKYPVKFFRGTDTATARINLGLGSAALASTTPFVGNDENLSTGAAVQSYVSNLVTGVFNYKGIKSAVENLPVSGNTIGDIWYITEDGSEWVWDGSTWQELNNNEIGVYQTVVGDGISTVYNINHGLNNEFIVISVSITDNDITYIAPLASIASLNQTNQIGYSLTIIDANNVSIVFTSAPDNNAAKISIISTSAVAEAINNLEDKAPAITNTASGSIAHFEDGSDANAKSVIAHIEPAQDLHGYDSPWFAGGGKNLLDIKRANSTTNGITFTKQYDNSGNCIGVLANGTATSNAYFDFNVIGAEIQTTDLINGQEYIFSGLPSIGSASTFRLRIGNSTGSSITYTNSVDGLTFEKTSAMVIFGVQIFSGYTANNLFIKPMIRFATEIDSSYTPYSNICPISGYTGMNISVSDEDTTDPTVYPITFPSEAGTVYGGYVNVTNGKLVVEYGNIASYNGETLSSIWISNRDVYVAGNTPTSGAQVVYKLAIPITYDITPQQIALLTGVNNVWNDCNGDTDVEYNANTKLYIEQLTKPTEDDMIANSNIASGTFFMIGNRLFLSTASIAVGETIVTGTNCTELSLADALNSLNVH